MAADLPPVYFTLFWPYLNLYFLIMFLVGKVPWGRTLLGFLAGMTYVFCLMNGIANLSRIITIGSPVFVAVQRLHWLAMVAWGVVSVGIVLKPAEWMRVVGLTAGVVELAVGIPLVIATTISLGRFSLFLLAPIGSLVLLILLIWPNLWERLTSSKAADTQASPSEGDPAPQTA